MNKYLSLFFAILCFHFTACSIAPMNTATTARSLGKDQNLATGSISPLGIKYERGLSERFDLGLGFETQIGSVFHLFGKYALINRQDDGLSFASIGGIGYGSGIADSKSFYVGPIVSYRKNKFEFFGAYKVNYVSWDFSQLSREDRDDLITIPSMKNTFIYQQIDAGINFIGDKVITSLGVRNFIFPDDTATIPFLDFGYKF